MGSGARKMVSFEFWEKDNARWLAEHENDPEEEPEDRVRPESVDPCPEIVLPLFPFQKEWLAWALNQEASTDLRGGILADEMGMGKTAQAISLVLTARPLLGPVVREPVERPQFLGALFRDWDRAGSEKLPWTGATLVICSAMALAKWEAEIGKFVEEGKARVLVYYGSKKKKRLGFQFGFGDYDFVLTTHSTLRWDYRKMEKDEAESPMHSVKWERIILDEAYFIKDRHTKTARAVFALDSVYKWILSPNALQHRVEELYSVVRFLKVYPYSCYFCCRCECHIFDLTVTRNCIDCPHSNDVHFCWWDRYIGTPVQSRREIEIRTAMTLLNKRVMKNIVLRRSKKGRAADLVLPPRIVSVRLDSLDKKELEIYDALFTQCQASFNGYVMAGKVMRNYARIFRLITMLQQAVNHPYLLASTSGIPDGVQEAIESFQFKTSTKIDALREEIRNMVESDGSAKGIAFSQFTSFLDCISSSLDMSGVKSVKLLGSMALPEREKAIKTFTEDGDCRILLMSLKVEGFAVDLTVASYVFFMDLYWDPVTEWQAEDRVHRIGQHKPIRIVRFVIEDTIDKRMLELQEKKELVIDGTVGHCNNAVTNLTEEELVFLFQI